MISLFADPRSRLMRVATLTLLLLATSVVLTQGQQPEPKVVPEWIRPQGIDGTLVLSGGGKTPEAALARFLQAAGGEKAKLVIIPSASERADTDAEQILKPWQERKIGSVTLLHARDRKTADTQAFAAALADATGVWFEDGPAQKIAQLYAGTNVEAELQKLLTRGGVIGGSGGAASTLTALLTEKTGRGFDLLPAGIVETHFKQAQGKAHLQTALEKHPGRVGYGIDEDTALIIAGRRIEVMGAGTVTVLLAAGNYRPAKSLPLKSESKQDLTALRRSALARASEAFPPKTLAVPEVPNGTLVIVGGGGMPAGLAEKFIEFAGGPDAPIVVLPTAGDPEIAKGEGTGMFTKAGAKNVFSLPSRLKKDVEDPKNLDILRKARGVWFGGGRQWHFVDAYEGTKAYPLLHDVLRRGGVIGGSSAGATIQGEYLSRGGVFNNTAIIYEGYERAFRFLPGVVIDQHFTQRKRFGDMTSLMKTYPQLLGIGIDETTALVVRGHVAEIKGKGAAHFYDYRTPPQAEEDYTAVRNGARYDLKERRVLP
jgi:cyanophycinase